MTQRPDVVIVDARLDCDAGLSFSDKVAGADTPLLLIVEAGEEAAARAQAAARQRHSVFAVDRELIERGEAPSDAVVRIRLCLLAANGRGDSAARRGKRGRDELLPIVAEPYDAIVLMGSAGTPHLLPRLLPKSRLGAAPLVVSVHHNPGFSEDFLHWVGELAGRRVCAFDPRAVAAAGSAALFAASAELDPDSAGRLGPDLGGLLTRLADRRLRLLVCIASGMADPVVAGLLAVKSAGGHVVCLSPTACSQPGMGDLARAAGVVTANVDVDAMAWLLSRGRARGTP